MSKITGVDKLRRKLDDLAKKAKSLDGSHRVPLNELLSPDFVSQHTRFATFGAMLDGSGFKIETAEDFIAIPDDKWDEFIRSNSSFPNWASMQAAAGKQWVAKKMGF